MIDEIVLPLALAAGLIFSAHVLLSVIRWRDIPFTALDAAAALVVVLDRTQRVVRCTQASAQVTGLPRAQVVRRTFASLFALPEQGEEVSGALLKCIADRSPLRVEYRLRAADGEIRWFLWHVIPGRRALFGGVELICHAYDITERKQQDRHKQALDMLNQRIREDGSAKDTLHLLVEQAAEFLRAGAAALLLVDARSGDLIFEKTTGLEPGAAAGWRIPLGSSAFYDALETRQPRILSAAAPEAQMLPPGLAPAGGSIALIPIATENDKAAGMLLAAGDDCCVVEDFQPFSAIALVAANVLHRHQLVEANRRQLQRLTALYTINIAVSASLDIHDIFHVLVDQITSQLGVDAADIFVVDAASRDLTLLAGSGFRCGPLPKMQLWMGQGRAGQVALERKSAQIYDAAGIDGLFLPDRSLAGEEFIGYEAVPLVIKGEVRGVLETFHRAPHERDPEWVEFLEVLATETIIAIANAEMMDQLQRSNRDLQLAYEATLEGWALALDMRDHDTEGHTRRVTDLTTRLAQSMGIRGDDLKYIRYGALLHDIGKIAIPDSILNKPARLTAEEMDVMRQHPEFSRQMLASIPFLAPARAIPCFHHERWDGTGYPTRLAGTQIPLPARVFAVVDVWDAMCSKRVYRDALPEAEVLEYIQQEAGRQFDPDVVQAFVNLLDWRRSHPGA